MKVFLIAVLIGGVLLFQPFTLKAEPRIEVGLKPSKSLKIGQTSALSLQLTWRSQEANYHFLRPQLTLENLVVEEEGESNETFQKEGKEWRKKEFHFKLKAIQSGKGKINAFQLNYIDPAQAMGGHIDIPSMELRIVPDHTKLYRISLAALGALTAGGLLTSLFFWRRSAQRDQPKSINEPTLEDRYLDFLHSAQGQLLEADRLFRSYLIEKYSFSRRAVTNREMMDGLSTKTTPEEMKTLKRIFDKLDEYRFNQRQHSQEEFLRLSGEIIRFVEGKRII